MKILLATDGSQHAQAAAELLTLLRLASPAQLSLMTVLNTEDLPQEIEVRPGELAPLQAVLLEKADQLLSEQASRLEPFFSSVETAVREGHPAEEIVQTAQELECDLVVTGCRGEDPLAEYLLGNVAFRVLQYAPCSVLLARPPAQSDHKTRPLRLVLGTDGSAASVEAAQWLKSSGILDGSEVLLVRVLTVIRAFRMDIVQTSSPAWLEATSTARQELAELAQLLEGAAARVSSQLREGEDAASQLIAAADESDSDLLIVASRGSGAVQRFLLGSVSTKVAHYAGCSVLVVK